MNPVNVKALPYRIRMIAERIGMERTYQLLVEHGAECHKIPGEYVEGCALANNLGTDVARALIELWPESAIDLPKPDKILIQWRDKELTEDIYERDMPIREAVKKYNLTRQRINQILNQHRQDNNLTLDLDGALD